MFYDHLQELCSTSEAINNSRKSQGNAIKKGFEWLIDSIDTNYESLRNRVTNDVEAQKLQEKREKEEKMERVKKIREERFEKFCIVALSLLITLCSTQCDLKFFGIFYDTCNFLKW